MSSAPIHLPILVDEVLHFLAIRPGARVIDATINGGGHAAAILDRIGPRGRLLGLDRDPEVAARARQRFAADIAAGRAIVETASFARIGEVAAAHGLTAVDAILFDLGLSSFHLDQGGRGFSFSRDEPLDLRFDPSSPEAESAAHILATRDTSELTRLFRDLGEERYSSRISRAVVAARAKASIDRSSQLFDLIVSVLPAHERPNAGRSAARIFQALRIAANDELGEVRASLPQAVELLAPGGRIAVLSFHSLEDRLVKQLFLAAQRDERLEIVTKRPLRPSDAEIAANSRAASAKLRIAERCREDRVDASEVERLLRFWIGEDHSAEGCAQRSDLWFTRSDATDNYIRERFAPLLEKGLRGQLDPWAVSGRGRLALVILLDQFSRNLHRGTARAFAGDEKALRLCLGGIENGMVDSMLPLERAIFGMPLEHCEEIAVQERSVRYFSDLAAEVDEDVRPVFASFADSARQHRDIIARFGRFPHRNEALGRESTAEEEEFLRGAGSRF